MSYAEIANFTGRNTHQVADVIVDHTFAYRFIGLLENGFHTLTLRSTEDRSIVARTTSDKGKCCSRDFMRDWIFQEVRKLHL